MLPTVLILLAQVTTPTGAKSPGNFGEDLFYASMSASGSKLCNRRHAARYQRQFDRRYGDRIRALVVYHESRFGKGPGFIVTTDCRRSQGSVRQQDLEHAKAMNRFEPSLRELEVRYGPSKTNLSTSR